MKKITRNGRGVLLCIVDFFRDCADEAIELLITERSFVRGVCGSLIPLMPLKLSLPLFSVNLLIWRIIRSWSRFCS